MTSTSHQTKPDVTARALAAASEENIDVKVRVQGAASDLASSRAVFKSKMDGGNPEMAAKVALRVSKEVEDKVKECADDLDAVNETLAHGVMALENTEIALAVAQPLAPDIPPTEVNGAIAQAEKSSTTLLLSPVPWSRHPAITCQHGSPGR